jgi:hypothetical protein
VPLQYDEDAEMAAVQQKKQGMLSARDKLLKQIEEMGDKACIPTPKLLPELR